MDIQILKEFVDLAYTLNFGKTAERMYVGQSTLSKHIIALEKDLGTQLFIRMCRKTPSLSYGDIRRVHRIYASN